MEDHLVFWFGVAFIVIVAFILFLIILHQKNKEAATQNDETIEIEAHKSLKGQELPFPTDEYHASYLVIEVDDEEEKLYGNVVIILPVESEVLNIQRFATDRFFAWEAGFCIVAKIGDEVRTLSWDWEADGQPRDDNGWAMNVNEIFVRFA